DRIAGAVEQRIAGAVGDGAVGHQAEPSVTSQAYAARGRDGEPSGIDYCQIERIAGASDRAGSLLPPSCAVLGEGDVIAAWRRVGTVLPAEPVAELYPRGFVPGRVGIGDVAGNHVHRALLRDQSGCGDATGEVHLIHLLRSAR